MVCKNCNDTKHVVSGVAHTSSGNLPRLFVFEVTHCPDCVEKQPGRVYRLEEIQSAGQKLLRRFDIAGTDNLNTVRHFLTDLIDFLK